MSSIYVLLTRPLLPLPDGINFQTCLGNLVSGILVTYISPGRLRNFERSFSVSDFVPFRMPSGSSKWRKFYNEEIKSLYVHLTVRLINSRTLRWAGHIVRMEEEISAFNILTGKPTGKRPLGSPRRR